MKTNRFLPMNDASNRAEDSALQPEERAKMYFQQAYKAHMNGELDDAVRLYTRALETFPTPEAHTFLGWAYSHQGHLEEAIAECEKAIDIDPDYGNPYNDMGAYLMELGRFEEAEESLTQALYASRYETPFFSRFNLGRLKQRQGKWFEALEQYQLAHEIAEELGVKYDIAMIAHTLLQAQLN
jgi:tetratricopeptide (TPR) repeat protein